MFQTYFQKLDITPKELSLELVKEIQTKHLASFAFNNVAVLLGDEISLNIDKIIDKIVAKNLGGYCFEQNTLMYEVLNSLGFKVRLLIGKVLNNMDVDVPRTHRVTLLEFEGESYLVDVGFGSHCPRKPMKIDALYADDAPYRIMKNAQNEYLLEVLGKEEYFTLYKFDLHTYTQADCVMGNFYSSNYKNAVFVNNLILSLILPNVTLSLRNRTYHRIFKDKTEVVHIEDSLQLHSIITNEFKLALVKEQTEFLYKRIEK